MRRSQFHLKKFIHENKNTKNKFDNLLKARTKERGPKAVYESNAKRPEFCEKSHKN